MEETSSQLEIPFWVNGTQKWVTGITKRTTCDDVIYSLLYHEDRHKGENTHKYAIYENWREVERPLQGRTKIMKIWNAWESEHMNVQFIMRRISESDFTESCKTRRKYRKSRGRSRNTRDPQSRNRQSRHANCDHSSERFTFMENLVKLVISQERLISDISSKVTDTEAAVDTYETKLHLCRLEQNGENYVQSAYLDSLSEDSMDEFLHNVDIDNLDSYLNFCDRIVYLEDELTSHHSKIEDLSVQIQDSFTDMSVSLNLDDNVFFEEELVKLQAELNRVVSSTVMQQYKSDEVSKEIGYYDQQLSHKRARIENLEIELSYIEEGQNYQNIVADSHFEHTDNSSHNLETVADCALYENVIYANSLNKNSFNHTNNTQEYSDKKTTVRFTSNKFNNIETCEKSQECRTCIGQNLSFSKRSEKREEHDGVCRTNSMSHYPQSSTSKEPVDQSKISRTNSVSGCAKLLRSVHAQNKSTRNKFIGNRPQAENEENILGYENVTFYKNAHFENLNQKQVNRTLVPNDIRREHGNITMANAAYKGVARKNVRPQVLMKTFVAENVPKDLEHVYNNIQSDNNVTSARLSSLHEDILNPNKGDDNDSNSDTGLSSMNSDESITYLETLV